MLAICILRRSGDFRLSTAQFLLDFTFRDDKNTSLARTGAKNLQIMKKIVMSILRVVKVCYKISMKRIRYKLSLDYENELEKMLSIIDLGSIKKALQ